MAKKLRYKATSLMEQNQRYPLLYYESVFYVNFYYSVNGVEYAVNWTKASVAGVRMESHLHDPAVKPLSPCPCDMKGNHCDVNCCCDQDCSDYDMESFTCLVGLNGGQQTLQELDYICNFMGPYSPHWHKTLCYIKNNNPFLGLFFRNEPIICNFQLYIARLSNLKYSYEDLGTTDLGLTYHSYYVQSSALETLLSVNNEIFRSVLTLPQQFGDGMCVISAPVLFLEEFKHTCPLELSPVVCESHPILQVGSYLQENVQEDFDTDNYILAVINDLTTLKTVNTSVTYKCIDDSKKFIK
ncbi:hypothetical protein SK128_004068, partial [Halocaridina rubra]